MVISYMTSMPVVGYSGLLGSDWLGNTFGGNSKLELNRKAFRTWHMEREQLNSNQKADYFGKVTKTLKYLKLIAEKRRKSAFLLEEDPHCHWSVKFTYAW